ncbi:MAG: hypothetical protein WDM77_14825 [Steroidobacteraceae bacterium]
MSLQGIRQAYRELALAGPCQILVITLCVAINMLDGFDILALSLISPTLSREWQLTSKPLGLLFSAGLVGTAVGGFLLSAIAGYLGPSHRHPHQSRAHDGWHDVVRQGRFS